ncbi:hypothetical protein AB0I81_58325 [Nonomuraea sp. NPDC050404]|uniref:hypothetical protein n=1 Tax=Nonomuraea sp. NPDC050404 TaxID=3155783 RepID=UPI0033D00176
MNSTISYLCRYNADGRTTVRFWKTFLGLARNKLVGPPIVLAAIVLALAGYLLVPTRYLATASMVLTISATGGTLEKGPAPEPGLTNPLLQFSDALRTTAGILILATNNERVAAELGAAEGGPTKLLINDGRTDPDLLSVGGTGPFIHIEVEGTSKGAVRDVLAKAQSRVRTELKNWQTSLGAPPITHMGMLDVRPAAEPQAVVEDKLTAAAGGGVLGLVGGFAVAYAIPRLRPASRPDDEPEPQPQPQPEPVAVAVAAESAAEPEPVFDADPDPMAGTLVRFGFGPVRPPQEAKEAVGNGSRSRLGALSELPRDPAPDPASRPDETDTQTFPVVKHEEPDETDTQTFPVAKPDEPDGEQQ